MRVSLLIAASVLACALVYAQDLPSTASAPPAQASQAPQVPTPVVTVPGTPQLLNPDKPSQPAVSVKEVESPAAPSHYLDQAIWALMVSFVLKYLMRFGWFPLSEGDNARLKAQFGFITAVLTAAGIHFAVTGNILDGGATLTVSGLSLDALKDIGWQWAAQEALYQKIVKT